MFLVCDKTRSERALALREKILRAGHPCACSAISEIGEYLPLLRIITFTDVLNDVRQTPYDDVRILAIGEGFVNSALNADQVNREEDVLTEVENTVTAFFHVKDEWVQPFGVFYDDGTFMSRNFFQIFGNIIIPTDREYLIFKYLQMTAKVEGYVPPERICRFCYPFRKIPKNEREAAKNLAVHMANLNQKARKSLRCNLIASKRFIGYRISQDI